MNTKICLLSLLLISAQIGVAAENRSPNKREGLHWQGAVRRGNKKSTEEKRIPTVAQDKKKKKKKEKKRRFRRKADISQKSPTFLPEENSAEESSVQVYVIFRTTNDNYAYSNLDNLSTIMQLGHLGPDYGFAMETAEQAAPKNPLDQSFCVSARGRDGGSNAKLTIEAILDKLSEQYSDLRAKYDDLLKNHMRDTPGTILATLLLDTASNPDETHSFSLIPANDEEGEDQRIEDCLKEICKRHNIPPNRLTPFFDQS